MRIFLLVLVATRTMSTKVLCCNVTATCTWCVYFLSFSKMNYYRAVKTPSYQLQVNQTQLLRNVGADKKFCHWSINPLQSQSFVFLLLFGMEDSRAKANTNLKKSQKMGENQVQMLYHLGNCMKKVFKIIEKIMSDVSHPLHGNYVFLRSNRRLAVPVLCTSMFKNSFVPKSMKLYNHIKTKININ